MSMKAIEKISGMIDEVNNELNTLTEKNDSALMVIRRARMRITVSPDELTEANEVLAQIEKLQGKAAILQKLVTILALVENQVMQFSGFDEFADVFAEALQGIATEGIEPVGELLNKLLPGFGSIMGSTIKTFEPSVIEAINFAINEIANIGEGIQESQKRIYKVRAGNRMNALTAYTDAGFTRDEALALILNDSKGSSTSLIQRFDQASKNTQRAVSKMPRSSKS